jgi:farnesyl diphosphate synthase
LKRPLQAHSKRRNKKRAYLIMFFERLTYHAKQVETCLDEVLTLQAQPDEIARPARLMEAMRYVMLGGGKRLRPFLTLETAALFGISGDGPLRAGAAIELLHGYSLVHDDLPAMDDDDVRRGKPTLHKAFDEATAILAGDALQTLSFEMLTDPRTHADATLRCALTLGLAKASGLGGMAGGQMLDLAAEGRYGIMGQDEAAIRQLQAMKTGALLCFAVEAGAILGRADDQQRAALRDYGLALGAAFQIADDLLDLEASSEQMGKKTGKDAAKGKATLASLLGIEGARAECARLQDQGAAALKRLAMDTSVLEQALAYSVQRKV